MREHCDNKTLPKQNKDFTKMLSIPEKKDKEKPWKDMTLLLSWFKAETYENL